jgi:hypothetical protein
VIALGGSAALAKAPRRRPRLSSCVFAMCYGPEFISKELDLWGTTSDRRCPVFSSNSIARRVLLRMGRQHVRGGTISVRQQKTGAQLDIPLHSDLVAAIAATPTDQMAFLVGRRGKAYSPQSFGHWFNKACKAAGLEVGCPPKGYAKRFVSGWRHLQLDFRFVASNRTVCSMMSLLETGWRQRAGTRGEAALGCPLREGSSSECDDLGVSNRSDWMDSAEPIRDIVRSPTWRLPRLNEKEGH